jgi:hypothetical protein
MSAVEDLTERPKAYGRVIDSRRLKEQCVLEIKEA